MTCVRVLERESGLELFQVSHPEGVGPRLRRELIECWIAVTNAGGAAGFPFPPVGDGEVGPVADAIVGGLSPERSRLIVARGDGALVGWVQLRRDPDRLVGHWGSIHHLQTRPDRRGRGVGAALVGEARRIARDELGLEQLRLAARGGEGLEEFYARLGWREAGRWPGALRLAPGDDRDEVLMVLTPL
ncbi:GNAT family N-acetyltransferase [Streptomyces sp. NPDC007945]|uniref:GNAT family N-acetyltransferase n=1 Tax=Streptomyces sp. NPDC007945 TaxID=3364797 RepID=UPI0036E9B171